MLTDHTRTYETHTCQKQMPPKKKNKRSGEQGAAEGEPQPKKKPGRPRKGQAQAAQHQARERGDVPPAAKRRTTGKSKQQAWAEEEAEQAEGSSEQEAGLSDEEDPYDPEKDGLSDGGGDSEVSGMEEEEVRGKRKRKRKGKGGPLMFAPEAQAQGLSRWQVELSQKLDIMSAAQKESNTKLDAMKVSITALSLSPSAL